MSGFEADIDALRAAARAAASVAEHASSIDLGGCLEAVPAGLPGSASAAAAASLAEIWRERLSSWAETIADHGDKVSMAADGYGASDEAAETAFGGIDLPGLVERVLPWP